MKKTKAERAKINAGRDYKKEYSRDQKKRVGYRVDLRRANRKAGTDGNGDNKDMSHDSKGRMRLEDQSTNRARNGKNGKSTKRKA